MGSKTHSAVQNAAPPWMAFVVQASWSSQMVGHVARGSQVSPASMIPLSQAAIQSESLFASQPLGQQPSPEVHAEIGVFEQSASQVEASPVRVSAVHTLPSSQLVGQLPGGSQVSPPSITPFPQL